MRGVAFLAGGAQPWPGAWSQDSARTRCAKRPQVLGASEETSERTLGQGQPPSPLEGPEFSLDFLRLHPEGSSYLRDEAIELKRIGSQG